MSKHTPGPWRATGRHVMADETEDRLGMTVLIQGGNRDDNLANLRLIATAPDLLAAIEAAIECGMVPVSSAKDGGAAKHSIQVQVADQLRAAVAKATGRPA